MPEEQPQTTSSKDKPQFEYVESREGLQNIYSNHLQALWTPSDVRIRFGELIRITNAEDGPRVFTIEDRAAVTLSWTQAKYLHNVLAKIIDDYEKLNGELKVPEIP